MTGYSSGMRNKRIDILNREKVKLGTYGRDSSGVTWSKAATVWAAVDWAKGMRAMNAGSIDVYGIVLVRMNYNDIINHRSRIRYPAGTGGIYQVLPETFHADKQAGTIQFNAQAIVDGK